MSARLLDGQALAVRIQQELVPEVDAFRSAHGRPPALGILLVGDDPASDVYIRGKQRAAGEVGIEARDVRLPATTTEAELLETVAGLNADDGVDGLLVQLPLPEGIDEARVIRAVAPIKDVDGFHPLNAGQLLAGTPTFVGATPLGVMRLLADYRVPTAGARAVVVGRSPIVGKPMALLLLQANATVTVCHSRTDDLARHTLDADILVAAVGSPGLITADMVKAGSTVIDVGITRTDAGLVGDVDSGVAELAAFLTPVPGGVGPMTRAMLLASTVKAARYRRGLLPFP